MKTMNDVMEKFTSPHISMRYSATMKCFIPDRLIDRSILRSWNIKRTWKESELDDLLAIVSKEGYWLETIDTREEG